MINTLKENALNILGWVLVALSIMLFVGALCALAYPAFSAKPVESDTFRLAGDLVTMSGVLAALGATLLAQSKNFADKKEQQSRFHLDSWRSAYEKASNLLGDGNNDRAKWVHAARVLMLAEDLEKKITEESHRRIFEMHQMKYRYFFSEVLDKPGIHFYGVSPRVMKEIDKLSREGMLDTAEGMTRGGKIMDHPYEKHESDVDLLPEQALYAVWKVAKWPDEYREPLDGLKFSEEERHRLSFGVGGFLGIAEYLDHKDAKRERDLRRYKGEN